MSRRWGIMGTGRIAAALAKAIHDEGGTVAAVGSGSMQRAEAFAAANGAARAYGRHHDVAVDPDVEVVYVATTNERHHLDALACIEAGTPVLVEKPFALDASTARSVIAAATQAGVFVMEAMWMLLQPGYLELQRRVRGGHIGVPRLVQADFGFPAPADPDRRWYSAEHGGGALLDVGVYPLALAIAVLGPPVEVAAVGELAATGVDEQLAVALRHPAGVSALACSFAVDSGVEATVAGSEGSLRLHGPFHHATTLSFRRQGHETEVAELDTLAHGYRAEVREVHRCLAQRRLESDAVPHATTISVLETADHVRAQLRRPDPDPR